MIQFIGIVKDLKTNQAERFNTLQVGKIRGIQYEFDSGILFANVESPLSEGEKQDLIEQAKILPYGKTKYQEEQEAFASHPFRHFDPDQAINWIDANVTDLASAKAALKKMSWVLIYLMRKAKN